MFDKIADQMDLADDEMIGVVDKLQNFMEKEEAIS